MHVRFWTGKISMAFFGVCATYYYFKYCQNVSFAIPQLAVGSLTTKFVLLLGLDQKEGLESDSLEKTMRSR
jgi:hypothetical protein